ncbi:MAG: adenylyl-sulfate kinase, partial [Deltaproteobacteria bacterium]|nr:adenylyl-sulfate kinase [Deltaproteobacteria bacterium]
VRHGLCADLSFNPEDRSENIRRIGGMTKLLVDAGLIVLTAFISPYRKDRQKLQSLFHDGQFLEIYIDCPPETCSKRDQKGLYAKAKAGVIKEFTGVSAPYEPPENPSLTIPSHKQDPKEAAASVIRLIQQQHIIKDALLDNEVSSIHPEGSDSTNEFLRAVSVNPESQK